MSNGWAEYRQIIVDNIEPEERGIEAMRADLAMMDSWPQPLDAPAQEIYDMTVEIIKSSERTLVKMREWEKAKI